MDAVAALKRGLILVFFVAALVWGALIFKAIRDPEHEPQRQAEARTVALVVAFIAGSVLSSQRKR